MHVPNFNCYKLSSVRQLFLAVKCKPSSLKTVAIIMGVYEKLYVTLNQ